MKGSDLNPAQLTDLLNYVLCLPKVTPVKRTIVKPSIDVLVVRSWSDGRHRRSAEMWCESQLMLCGLLPKPEHKPGRPVWRRQLPRVLEAWVSRA